MTASVVAAPVRALSATLSVQTLAALAQQVPVVLAGVLALRLDVGEQNIGYFTGIVYLLALSSGLFFSTRIKRIGAVRVSQWAMLCCAAGLITLSAKPLPIVIVGAVLLGIGYGLANPTAAVILGEHAPVARRGFFFSIKQTGVPLGIALAGLLAPALYLQLGITGAMWAVAVICVVCAVGLQPTVSRFDRPGGEAGATPGLLAPLIPILRSRPLRRLATISFIYAAMQVCFLTFLVVYLTTERSMSLAAAASILAAGQLASVAGRLFWGWVADLTGNPAKILGGLGIAMGCAFVSLAALPDPAGAAAAFLAAMFCGLTAVAWNGVFYAELVHQADSKTLAEVTGGVQALTFAGAMTGPVLFGFAVSITQTYAPVFMAVAIVPVLAGLMMLMQRPDAKRNG